MIWENRNPHRQVDYYAAPDADDWQDAINAIIKLQGCKIDTDQPIGTPIIFDGNPASIDNPHVIGLVIGKNKYNNQGILELNDWSAVANGKYLEPGKIYYLSMVTPGTLTTNYPTYGALVIIGIAQTVNKLKIDIQTPIYF